MKPFTKSELKAVLAILLIVGLVTLYNLGIAIRRSRDSQRKSDLGSISDALHKYHADFGFFPPSLDGRIKACKGKTFDKVAEEIKNEKTFNSEKFFESLRPCDWGKDKLSDLFDETYPDYLSVIPQDPQTSGGLKYLYLSNNKRFQLFTYLEGGDSEDGYDKSIFLRGLGCGREVCSYGKTYGETPLNKSIEEYEEDLVRAQNGGK